MAQLVYATRFDVPGDGAWEKAVRPRYERWVSDRYRIAFGTALTIDIDAGEIAGRIPDGHQLAMRRYDGGDAAYVIDWTFPGDDGLLWRNVIRSACLADRCVVEHRCEISSADYLLAPARYSVGAPGVVRTICRREVLVGEMRVKANVYPLHEQGVDEFVKLLSTPLRRLPLVLVTPFANGEPGDLDPGTLADRLAGVAIVTEADTPETTRALSDRMGRLGCFDGGIRIYWPGFDLDDDVRRHPLIFGSRIAVHGPDRAARIVERAIFSVATFRFSPDPRISSIIETSEAADRAERAQDAVNQGDGTWEQYALEMAGQLDGAQAELVELRAENENLKANQSLLFAMSGEVDDEQDVGEEAVEKEAGSVREAVDLAAQDCPKLIFLDSSRESADDSPFRRPGEIYEVLSMMNKVADVWARNHGSGDLWQMLKDEGLGRRVSNFISQTAKGKWADEYTFVYEGKPTLFEWHVTLGARAADTCASIHFLPDPEKGKLVIGHVGRHLTNTRS